jgi:hypothetical protein
MGNYKSKRTAQGLLESQKAAAKDILVTEVRLPI